MVISKLQSEILGYLEEKGAFVAERDLRAAVTMRRLHDHLGGKDVLSRPKLLRNVKELEELGVVVLHNGSGQGGKKYYLGLVYKTRQEYMRHLILLELNKLQKLCMNEGMEAFVIQW